MLRRPFVLSLMLGAGLARPARGASTVGVAALQFPADFGAHPEARIEWWYATGSLLAGTRSYGFQVTFFRARTSVDAGQTSRFAATQLVFAHAALTDLEARRLRHDERIARAGFDIAAASTGDTRVTLRDWSFVREGGTQTSRYHANLASTRAGFALDLTFDTTQAPLLQGNAGVSQKGPSPQQSSRYYSQPQLTATGTLVLDGTRRAVQGRAWLDHEWSDSFLDTDAVGWDWIGMNLDDGAALTAFRLRRRDGSALWAGGSFRRPGEAVRNFAPNEVAFEPRRRWSSAASKATYPVEWIVATPAGRFGVQALLDDQELDSRASTGAIYWEGLSELVDARGARVGRGYLEMTGYAAPLTL